MPDGVWKVAVGLAGLGAALFLADRLLLWMERRGWIYWRRRGLGSIGVELVRAGDPAAQAADRAMAEERVRKNVRPAGSPPIEVDLDARVIRLNESKRDGREP
jgi:hypothetical protein